MVLSLFYYYFLIAFHMDSSLIIFGNYNVILLANDIFNDIFSDIFNDILMIYLLISKLIYNF